MSYKVKLQMFEGPFDLLVYLIENAKMSIYDIKISEITEQYLDYVDDIRNINFNVASEFMVLAATLIDIKSRMMLPSTCEDDVDVLLEDPRTELVQKLLEYKMYKAISEELLSRREYNLKIFEKPKEDISIYTENPDELLNLSLSTFVSSFNLFLKKERKISDIKNRYKITEADRISLEEKLVNLRKRLREIKDRGENEISFKRLIDDSSDRYDISLTFASVLQMMKDKTVDATQKELYGDITVIPKEN